jgi:hypothetical protein
VPPTGWRSRGAFVQTSANLLEQPRTLAFGFL